MLEDKCTVYYTMRTYHDEVVEDDTAIQIRCREVVTDTVIRVVKTPSEYHGVVRTEKNML